MRMIAPASAASDRRATTVYLPRAVVRHLRIVAAERGTSMAALVRQAVEAWVGREAVCDALTGVARVPADVRDA